MDRKSEQRLFLIVLFVCDVLMVGLSFVLAYFIRFRLPAPKGIPDIIPYIKALIFAAIIFALVFRHLGFYRPRRGRPSRLDEFYSVMIGSGLATIILVGCTFFYRGFEYSRGVILIGLMLSVVLVGTSRTVLAAVEEKLRDRGIGAISALIVGTGKTGRMIDERIRNHHGLGYRVIGFLEEDEDFSQANLNVLGRCSDIGRVLIERRPEMVFIAVSSGTQERITVLANECRKVGVDFRVVSPLFEIMTSPVKVEEIDGIPVFGLREEPLHGCGEFVKRSIDIGVSFLGLLLTGIPMLLLAIIIKLTSKGSVFFRQERVGRGGRNFSICKFRSMFVGAESESGPVWTKNNDPRCTRVGVWIRKFSLDELPQLWCVLKGEMSLIGPRPERPVFVEKFSRKIPRYAERHKVKPGLTGWAQVNGLRGNTAIEERTRLDLYYVDNWSLLSDVRIFIRTVFEFVFHKEAY